MKHTQNGLVFGIGLLALGTILLLDRMGILDASQVFSFFWPVVLLTGGLLILARATASAGRVWGGILTTLGILLFLDELGYARLSLHALWPLAIIAIGLLLVWRSLEGGAGGAPGPDAHLLNRITAFGGGELKSDAQDFRGGELLALFGGYQVDLRRAAIVTSPAVLRANAMFGGIDLRVPRNWRVTVDGLPLLGGYLDKSKHPEEAAGVTPPQLIVRGFAMFGGVVVKN